MVENSALVDKDSVEKLVLHDAEEGFAEVGDGVDNSLRKGSEGGGVGIGEGDTGGGTRRERAGRGGWQEKGLDEAGGIVWGLIKSRRGGGPFE